jgi:uncharacterized protein
VSRRPRRGRAAAPRPAAGGPDAGPGGRQGPVGAHPEGAVLRVRVVPGASATGLAGELGGALRVRVAAPPVEGRANAALLAFLAGRLGLRPRDLRVEAGASGRDKLIVVRGRSPEQVDAALQEPGGGV